ncbi:MAG: acyl carrier protein [Ignavibacteriales bacterium]|nr:acyl carrier protein [Ignavibacteriales bacterium]
MTREEVAARVVGVTAQQFAMKTSDIKESDQFTVDLGADSLKSIELVAAYEEAFGLSVKEEEALKVQDVGGAIDFFFRLLQ